MQLFYHYHHSSDELMDSDEGFDIASVPSFAVLPPEDFLLQGCAAKNDLIQKYKPALHKSEFLEKGCAITCF